jgi:uncharacterized phage protein (TIGR01671 family)
VRELKFRAWSKPTMFYNVDFRQPEGNVVMQYTGLKDKNGREIYDGDILRGFGGLVECYWDEGADGCYGGSEFRQHRAFRGVVRSTDCEVIGNIYESPELLENNAA